MTSSESPRLVHAVFFSLKDASSDGCDALVAAAHRYLDGHDGCLSFGVGKRAEIYARDVNDDRFHVALNVVFESQEAHDQYQAHQRHLAFIEEQSSNWAEVRVFDSWA